MLPISFDEMTAAHIESLLESEIPENLTLEYKQELPARDQRKEFLCDIAAMANARGGDFIYGIAERRDEENKTTGIPEKLTGLQIPNEQEEIIRLSSCIRDSGNHFASITEDLSHRQAPRTLLGCVGHCKRGASSFTRSSLQRWDPHTGIARDATIS